MQDAREIKIEEKLSELLAVSDKSYDEIAKEIDVSSSSIAQYQKGQARPSLDNLVALSDVFDVSLDYLVFGKDSDKNEINAGPVVRHMNQSLQDSQLRQAKRIAMVSNVGRRISQKLDEEIENYLSHPSTQQLFAGTIAIQRWQHWNKTVSRHAYSLHRSTIICLIRKPTRQESFFTIVANNLSQGHEYQYLLPAANEDWASVVSSFRDLLIEQLHSEATVRNNCEFRVTETPTMIGCAMYQLDKEGLRSEYPMIYDFISEHDYCSDGWFGYPIGPSKDAQGTMIMDDDHLDRSIQTFEFLWENANSV